MTRQANPALAVVGSLVLYLLLTSTLFPPDFLFVYDAKRLLQLVLFAAVMVLTVSWTPIRTATIIQLNRLSALDWFALSLVFLIGTVSSLKLTHPAYAIVDVSMMFVMMLLVAVTAASRDIAGRSFDKWALLSLAAMGLVVFIQEFMGFIVGWAFGSEFSYTQALVHFAHPRFYNQLQTLSLPVIAALPLIFPDKRWLKLGCITLLGFQWFLVIATAARGTFVSVAIAMVFIALWLPDLRKYWLKYQLLGLLAGMMIYSGVFFVNGLLIPQSQSGEFYAQSLGRPMAHTSGRSGLWRLSIEDATSRPFLGSGPTRFACGNEQRREAHPHNFLLRIAGEWGLVSLFLLLSLIVTISVRFLKNLKFSGETCQTDPPLKAMLAISLIAGFIHACLSGLLIMPASQVAIVLIAGWNLSLSGRGQSQPQKFITRIPLLIAGVLIAVATLVFATNEAKQLPERTGYEKDDRIMHPRFWQNGSACRYIYVKPQPAK